MYRVVENYPNGKQFFLKYILQFKFKQTTKCLRCLYEQYSRKLI